MKTSNLKPFPTHYRELKEFIEMTKENCEGTDYAWYFRKKEEQKILIEN